MSSDRSDLVDSGRALRLGSLRDLLYVVFRHGKKALVVAAACAVVLLLVVWRLPVRYRSEAKVMVRTGPESADPIAAAGAARSASASRDSQINSELEILASQDLLRDVVRAVGPAAILCGETAVGAAGSKVDDDLTGRAIRQLEADLSTDVVAKSSIVSVRYANRQPEAAKLVLDRLLSAYLAKHIDVYKTPGSYEFFEEQRARVEQRIAELGARLRERQKELGVTSIGEQQRMLADRIREQDSVVEGLQASIQAGEARLAEIERSLLATDESVVLEQSSSVADTARNRLFELELRLKDVLAKYSADSRSARDLQDQIAFTRQILAGQHQDLPLVRRGINANHQKLQLDLLSERVSLAAQRAQLASVDRQRSEARARLERIGAHERELVALQREVEIEEANHRRYLEGLEQSRIDAALEQRQISNISVVQHPSLPDRPVGPSRAWGALIALLVAALAGAGALVAAQYFDDALYTPDQIEAKLGLPVLGSLDEHAALLASAAGESPAGLPEGIERQLRSLRERLLAGCSSESCRVRVLAVTAAHAGAGTSTVARHLAASLAAHAQGDVVLVESGAPATAEVAGSLAAVGAGANGASGAGVASGRLRRRSASMADGSYRRTLQSLLHEAPYRTSFVVLDLPPASCWDDPLRLLADCDGVVLVVDPERTRWQTARRTLDLLALADGKLLGAVLNRRKYPVPRWLYRQL